MKTSLAIATAALMLSAMLSLTSSVAAHDYGSLSGKSPGRCGVAACVIDLAPLPLPPGPGPYRGNR
jgi:hypothetical protein